MRAVDEHKSPVSIPRVLGVDREGILYIGKADAFTDRVIYLKKCLHPRCMTVGHHQVWARLEGSPALCVTQPSAAEGARRHGSRGRDIVAR